MERLEQIKESEVEQGNAEIVKFSWSEQVLKRLQRSEFHTYLNTIGSLRNEVFLMIQTQREAEETQKRLLISRKRTANQPRSVSHLNGAGNGGLLYLNSD